jgi:hypothetical protein
LKVIWIPTGVKLINTWSKLFLVNSNYAISRLQGFWYFLQQVCIGCLGLVNIAKHFHFFTRPEFKLYEIHGKLIVAYSLIHALFPDICPEI